MNFFRQHVPHSIDSGEPFITFHFRTIAELLAHPLIRSVVSSRSFSYFVMDGKRLLAIEKPPDGLRFKVVGYVSDPLDINDIREIHQETRL